MALEPSCSAEARSGRADFSKPHSEWLKPPPPACESTQPVLPLCGHHPFTWLLPPQTLNPGVCPRPGDRSPQLGARLTAGAQPGFAEGDKAIAHGGLTRSWRRTFSLEAGPPTWSGHADSGRRRRGLARDEGGRTWPRSVLFGTGAGAVNFAKV